MKNILILLFLSLILKFAYVLLPQFVSAKANDKSYEKQYVSIAKKNDAFWYHRIARDWYPEIGNKRDLGYSEGENFKQSEWAFFPLYPALLNSTANLFHLNLNTSSILLSFLFSFLAIIGLYWFGLIYFKNQDQAFFNTLILFCFPFSFYFSMFYTEALFFTFMIYAFISLHYKKYFLLALILIPLTLVRANGIIILIPLYLYYLEQNGILYKFGIKWKQVFEVKNIIRSLPFLTAPLAFFLYCFYQYQMTGYFFAFSIAQDGWYRELTFPLLSFFRRGDIATQFNSVFAIIIIIYAIWNRKKLPVSLNILILISLLLPLCSGSVTSMTRFVSVIFPLFIILSSSIYHLKYRHVFLFLFLGLHFLSFYAWIVNHPISF